MRGLVEWLSGRRRQGCVKADSQDNVGNREYLLSYLTWQDSVMQDYRMQYLAFQGIVFAVGIGLSVGLLTASTTRQLIVFGSLLLPIAALGGYTSLQLRAVVKDIGAAMDYWEAELMKYEQSAAPSKRLLTKFRIRQQLQSNRRLSPSRFDKYLSSTESASDEDIGHLVGAAWSRSRRLINRHFFSLLPVCWLVLLVGGSVYMAIFLVLRP